MITYHGPHEQPRPAHHSVDYRTGPIYERQADGIAEADPGARDPQRDLRRGPPLGGWTQINHPTIFPPVNAAAAALCRGCFWEYSDAETDYSKVDAIEVATGPADIGGAPTRSPLTAIARYDRLLGLGYKIAAVGSSDSHKAGGRQRRRSTRPIGEATHRGVRAASSPRPASAAACRPATPT